MEKVTWSKHLTELHRGPEEVSCTTTPFLLPVMCVCLCVLLEGDVSVCMIACMSVFISMYLTKLLISLKLIKNHLKLRYQSLLLCRILPKLVINNNYVKIFDNNTIKL